LYFFIYRLLGCGGNIYHSIRHCKSDMTLAGEWENALDIYYDLIETGNDLVWKRMAIKQILKVNELNRINFDKLLKTIEAERIDAAMWYSSFLDFMVCEILIREGKYIDAIAAFSQKAMEYKGNPIEVEMLVRIANIYGDFLDDKDMAKVYADRAAAINPGAEIIESAYESAGIEYSHSLYVDKFEKNENENETIQTEPEIEPDNDTETVEQFVIISPNPANPVTTISYSINEASHVKLEVFNVSGQKVTTLVDGYMTAGAHSATFDGTNLSSGVYLYNFESKGFRKNGKLLIVR
ncbi:MAG: T9SS type A sorting domain-containing protein, partial [Candidatus Latescibacteria bacterium]|nr:T9SS type A sorting domain-containing protein [Candidatus Latescibacterota bacterium]